MTRPTRGFLGRRQERDPRLPPGQYDVGSGWPVLTAEPTPRIAPETWSITVDAIVIWTPLAVNVTSVWFGERTSMPSRGTSLHSG